MLIKINFFLMCFEIVAAVFVITMGKSIFTMTTFLEDSLSV